MYLYAASGGFKAGILRAPSDTTGTETKEAIELVVSQVGRMVECIHPALDNAVSESFTFKKSQDADRLEVNISLDLYPA